MAEIPLASNAGVTVTGMTEFLQGQDRVTSLVISSADPLIRKVTFVIDGVEVDVTVGRTINLPPQHRILASDATAGIYPFAWSMNIVPQSAKQTR